MRLGRAWELKVFREPVVPKGQVLLLPPCVNDFVGLDDPVRAVEEMMDGMELSSIVAKYAGGGAPAYDPRMLMKVIVFGYCEGVRSSRKLDAMLGQDLRFIYLAQMSRPDFRTIARFRRENLDAIRIAFEETVRLGVRLGLTLLSHVSVDGTKLEANVSGKHTYKRERLEKALEGVEARIAQILEEAEFIDEQEDEIYGDRRGDEMPKELVDARRRKDLLEKAKAELEEGGRSCVAATDVEARVMKTQCGNRPCYNAQAVVDKEHQMVVAARVSRDESDNHQLPAMMKQLESNTGMRPGCVSMDGGYNSEETLAYAEEEGLDAYVPDNQPSESGKNGFCWDGANECYICPCGERLRFWSVRQKEGRVYRVYRRSCANCIERASCCGVKGRAKELWRRVNGQLQEKMRAKMSTEAGKAIYRLRKQIIEPVFANIKENFKVRRLLLRGLEGAEIEYLLACVAHNIGKIRRVWGQNAHPLLAG